MKWNSFESHLLASQKELYFTKQFSDVTLVSDDLVEFLAHKTILSTASPMMKSLLGMSSQQQSSFLYLKGVTQENLEAILQYIYLGETEINEQKVQEFTKIAKDLGMQEMENKSVSYKHQLKVEKLDFLSNIKETSGEAFMPVGNGSVESFLQDNGLKTNLDFLNDGPSDSYGIDKEVSATPFYEDKLLSTESDQAESLIQDEFDSDDLKTNLGFLNDIVSESDHIEKNALEATSFFDEISEEIPFESEDTLGNEEYNDEEELPLEKNENALEDNQEEEPAVKKRGRKRKQQSTKPRAKEEPADCDICNTHYTTKRSYRRHYLSVHELRMLNCDECDQTFNNNDTLRIHRNRIHRNIEHPCPKCDRVYKDRGDLTNHIRIQHAISCDFHKKKFLTTEQFQEHIQEEHVKKYCT